MESGRSAGRLLLTGSACVGRLARKKPGRRVPARMDGVINDAHMKWAIGGIIVGLILLAFPGLLWLALALIVAAIAIRPRLT